MHKKIFLFLIRLFIVTIVILLVCELLLRWLKPVYFCNTQTRFQYDKELGFATRPNLDISILTDHRMEFFTNDIGSNNYLNKDELLQYKKTVFCIGDSFTEGIGLPTDATYPFYLDLLLNQKGNTYEKDFAVYNLGVGGYGSLQAYLVSKIYAEKIRKIPDVIIYFICANDFYEDITFKNGYYHRRLILGTPQRPYIFVKLNEMLEHCQLVVRLKLFLVQYIIDQTQKPQKAIEEDRKFNPDDLPGLLYLIKFSRENRIKLILSYAEYKSHFYDDIKLFAAENNILFADYKPDLEQMSSIFTRLPVKNKHSGGHYRSWVNFIIASNFAKLLK